MKKRNSNISFTRKAAFGLVIAALALVQIVALNAPLQALTAAPQSAVAMSQGGFGDDGGFTVDPTPTPTQIPGGNSGGSGGEGGGG